MNEAGAAQLTQEIAKLCNNRGADEVISACANIMFNCLRQNYGNRTAVLARINEIFERGASALMEHYDPVSGKRRSVVPFDQVVSLSTVQNDLRIIGLGGKANGGT